MSFKSALENIAIASGCLAILALFMAIILVPNRSEYYEKGCNDGIKKLFKDVADDEKVLKFCKDLTKEKK